jgi:tRNA pseudouridine38-40 synthase
MMTCAAPCEGQKFRLVIEYDGRAYCGWQRQKDDPTVQGTIEAALGRMTRQAVTLHGAGRTDAGVHALGQAAHFVCPTRLDATALRKGLNSLLPADIVIRACEPVAPAFHARFDARAKTYRYRILNRPQRVAVGRQYAWHIFRPLDLDAMQRAQTAVIGRHDFKAFENTGSPRQHTVREVTEAAWRRRKDDHLVFDITADGFLKFMVRNIVGTLVAVGLGKMPPEEVAAIRDSGDRRRAGAAAPAHGLFLLQVHY